MEPPSAPPARTRSRSPTRDHPATLANPPSTRDLAKLARAARRCRACPLWRTGTQTVFGQGPSGARILFIGEQPGDQEDLAGKPFIGPAGQLLNRALHEAGIDRAQTYVTNAVKHFKWEPSGKRRLHKKPNAREIAACHPWLAAEIHALQPQIIVCLGVTAAQSLLHRPVKITVERGRLQPAPAAPAHTQLLITVHPSSLLRIPDPAAKAAAWNDFLRDLRLLRP